MKNCINFQDWVDFEVSQRLSLLFHLTNSLTLSVAHKYFEPLVLVLLKLRKLTKFSPISALEIATFGSLCSIQFAKFLYVQYIRIACIVQWDS